MTILYEGVVYEIEDSIAAVRLIDLATADEYSALIHLKQFSVEDRPHCVPGSVFTVDHTKALALRRDVWTQQEVDRITTEARRKWLSFQAIVEDS